MNIFSKNGRSIMILALSLSFGLSHSYKCTVGPEMCNCEYIDCRTYRNALEYCEGDDYADQYCNSSDFYFYSNEYCNLTSVVCQDIIHEKYIPDFYYILNGNGKINISIRYKNFPVVNNSWFYELLNVPTLDISYNHIEKIEKSAFDRILGLKELNISINQLKEIKLNGLSELEVLDASRNFINNIQSSTFLAMPKLKMLILKFNNIEFIPSDAFNFSPELRLLNLKSNYLVELNTFSRMHNLILINLDENDLVQIGNGAFEHFAQLKILKIRDNNLERVSENAFTGLRELKKIRIGSNKLKQIIEVNGSLNLRLFSMVNNLVEIIRSYSFSKFKLLVEISMSLNKIVKLEDYAFNLPILAKLDLSGNYISNINSSDVFHGLANLTELFLSNNTLTSLLPFAFKKLVSLKILYLDDNLIESIQNNSFSGLNKLQNLSLRYNSIKRLNSSGFFFLSGVSTLELDSNKLTWIEKDAFFAMNSLKVLKLSNNKLSFIKNTFFASLKLQELYLSNNKISSIQLDSFTKLGSLTLLDLKDNNIFDLNPLMLNIAKLEKLNLQRNTIHSINNQTFMHVRNLKELDLSYNLLTILKPGIFSPLTKLVRLNLEKNPIAKIYFDCFASLVSLVYLNFGNDIKFLDTVPYSVQKDRFLPKLESIFFNYDTASVIKQFNFSSIQTVSINLCEIDVNISRQLMRSNIKKIYMKSLDLGNMSLTYYIKDFAENLLELDLSFNYVVFEKQNQFISKASNLEKLWLAGVNITDFDRTLNLTTFKNLVLLNLSNNMLDIIQGHFFKNNYELRYLYLSGNRIQKLNDYSFFSNGNLIILDISYNDIETLSEDMFAVSFCCLKKMDFSNNKLKLFGPYDGFSSSFESIRLDNNQLTELPTSIRFSVKLLDDLNISGNPIGTLNPSYFKLTNRMYNLYLRNCSIFFIENETFKKLHQLIILDLSHNDIKFLENEFFTDLESLQILSLSSNKILYIQKELFEELTRLTNLYLSSNSIEEVEDFAFVNLTSLKIINLDMNPIVNLFKENTFTGLVKLKQMRISNRVNMTLEIVESIKNQIKLRLVRELKVLGMKFYDSIEISFPPDFEINYSRDVCYYITYFIRNQISLNLDDEFFVHKFVQDCKVWSGDVYSETLDNLIDSIFTS